MKIFLTSLSLLALSGCVTSLGYNTLVVLQHPETKETRECRADAWTTWNVYAEVEACAKAYEKAGFERIGSY